MNPQRLWFRLLGMLLLTGTVFIAAPLVGGIFTSFIMELVVYPAIYEVWRWYFYVRKEAALGESSGAVGLST